MSYFYQSFLIAILINSTAFNIAWQVKNFVFYLQPCHLNGDKRPSFWFLEIGIVFLVLSCCNIYAHGSVMFQAFWGYLRKIHDEGWSI
jgi:hypothetical protein